MNEEEKVCRHCGKHTDEAESIGRYGFLCSECIKKLNGKAKDASIVLFGLDHENADAEYNYRTIEISFKQMDYGDKFLTALNHEFMHNILHRLFGVVVGINWDNVSLYGQYDSCN